MLFVELLAKKVAGPLAGVMLTIQRANTRALQFYTQKCRYTMDEISPSKTDPFAPAEEYGGLSMHFLTPPLCSLFSLPTPRQATTSTPSSGRTRPKPSCNGKAKRRSHTTLCNADDCTFC
jgi:hypothetical protein